MALAEAVIPIIRLLVAVATRSGTPITRCMTGTFTMPPPMPSRAETTPAPRLPPRRAADAVAGRRAVSDFGTPARQVRGRQLRTPGASLVRATAVDRGAPSIVTAT